MPPARSLNLLLAVTMLALAGCAAPPLPDNASDRAATGPYPALLPISDLLASTGTTPEDETAVTDDLDARAAALRARADSLR